VLMIICIVALAAVGIGMWAFLAKALPESSRLRRFGAAGGPTGGGDGGGCGDGGGGGPC
jgi:hypothetical protein